MNEPEVFVLADQALNNVVARIKNEQWQMSMPPSFAMRDRDRTPTLREIINYHAYDDAWVPDMLAGKTMDEAGKDTFAGDLLGDDPRSNFAALVERHAQLRAHLTISIGSCTALSATFQRASTSGKSTASAGCGHTISPG